MAALVFPQLPNGIAEIEKVFGKIEFESNGDGSIKITNGWDKDHIVHVTFPVVGRHAVHKLMVDPFMAVFQELEALGLGPLIKRFEVWCPRHQMWTPGKPLSIHSWAIGADVNPETNMPGKVGDLDPRVVAVFEKHGFKWGGRWKHRDDMHFQFATGF